MHDPRVVHQEVVDRIICYLKSCPGRGLIIEKNNHMRIEVYTYVNWAGCQDDRKSTSGHCVFVGGNLISWRSKKQNVVARSTAEAEYRAMTLGVSEEMWLQRLLLELGLSEKILLCYIVTTKPQSILQTTRYNMIELNTWKLIVILSRRNLTVERYVSRLFEQPSS
jgi:hypothetical protein